MSRTPDTVGDEKRGVDGVRTSTDHVERDSNGLSSPDEENNVGHLKPVSEQQDEYNVADM